MCRQTKAGATNTGSNQNPIYAGGISKPFDTTDYAEELSEVQCDLCHPPLSEGNGGIELCPDFSATQERTGEQIFSLASRPRKVIRLQRCFACIGCYAPSKFSPVFGICKHCLSRRNDAPAARRKLAARALNNIGNLLRSVMGL